MCVGWNKQMPSLRSFSGYKSKPCCLFDNFPLSEKCQNLFLWCSRNEGSLDPPGPNQDHVQAQSVFSCGSDGCAGVDPAGTGHVMETLLSLQR